MTKTALLILYVVMIVPVSAYWSARIGRSKGQELSGLFNGIVGGPIGVLMTLLIET